jgi:hypothetical protein
MENFSLADFNANLKLRQKIHCLRPQIIRSNKQKRAKTKNNEKNDDSPSLEWEECTK